ncbi:MAG TPA: glycosyltransferase family 39 protein [Streptosporangiaceae bacterium]|nr:glycosyltransferase family 39 protein [Streptosporangiaceae bacterium]
MNNELASLFDNASHGCTATQPDGPEPAPRRCKLGVGLIALAAFGVELAVSARYGYVRDELYFLAAGKHLAFGYVDQPLLTPLLARGSAVLTGNSLIGLRLLPALALLAIVIMTAEMSRLLGAGRTGQLLAALAAATCGEFLGAAHELTTTTPDFVFWTLTLLLVLRLLSSGDPRWWLAIGGCVGLAMEAKWNIAFLAASLAVGFALTPARHLLRSRHLLIGAAIAAALAAPDVIWQAAHGWPNLAVFRALQTQSWHNRATYWPGQIVFTGLALTPIWIGGLFWCLRGFKGVVPLGATLRRPQPGNSRARAFRPVAIACAVAITLQFVLGGKPYYSGAAYTFLLAAGCVWLEHRLSPRRTGLVATAMVVSAALILPAALPVLPARVLHSVPLQKINYDLAESIAWPRQVALIAREFHALPSSQRRHTTILAGNYGEAGALDRYGPGLGLPPAYSGANNFWLWGPPPASADSAIVVNLPPALLRRYFTHVRLIATFWNGLGVSDDEQGAQVFLATGRKLPWQLTWPAFRNYS